MTKIERKLQARGVARVQSLLEAAEIVFARKGYSEATTNDIAEEAKVSPATFYQFFANKEEIANALAQSYSKRVGELSDQIDYLSLAKMPLKEMVPALFNPMLKYHESHPAFLALLLDAPLSEETRKAKLALSEKFITNIMKIISARNSKISAEDARWTAETTMLLYKGFMGEIHGAKGKRRTKLMDTLKEALIDHLNRASS